MPIYHDGKKMKPYRGYRKPVNVYYGDKKVAGWKNSTQTGNNLTFQTTYNDTADVIVKGKSLQKSEWVHKQGLTTQDGIPTPEAPIPLISNLPAGTYKTQDWKGDWYEFTLAQDLGGIGDVRDSVEWDRVSHNGYLRKYLGHIASYDDETMTTDYMSTTGGLDTGAEIYYVLESPTRTPLTFTLNNSSTAPECPMKFLVFDASGTVKVRNADDSKNATATIPTLRKVGEVADEFNIKTGKLTRKIGRIESYNGEDVGDDWISSTGALDTGATVEYVLAEPIEEQYTPVTLPTYYPTTVITTTNDTPAELETTASVKVEDE